MKAYIYHRTTLHVGVVLAGNNQDTVVNKANSLLEKFGCDCAVSYDCFGRKGEALTVCNMTEFINLDVLTITMSTLYVFDVILKRDDKLKLTRDDIWSLSVDIAYKEKPGCGLTALDAYQVSAVYTSIQQTALHTPAAYQEIRQQLGKIK